MKNYGWVWQTLFQVQEGGNLNFFSDILISWVILINFLIMCAEWFTSTENKPNWPYGSQSCMTQWNYEPRHVGPPKMDMSWCTVLTKCGPLENFSFLGDNILYLDHCDGHMLIYFCQNFRAVSFKSVYILKNYTVKVKVKSLSRVQLFVTPWTVAYQYPQSMGFSRQEYWNGLPFPSLGGELFITNCRKFLKGWVYQTTLPASWEIYMQVKKQHKNWTWNNRLVPNRERSTSRLHIVTLLI